jgi:hypothetical protein
MIQMDSGMVLTFAEERSLYLRERSVDAYATATYFLSKLVAEIPYLTIFPLVSLLITYWWVGFPPGIGPFFRY